MAGNAFETVSNWLTMVSLDILESKRAVSHFFSKEWSREFDQKFPIGDTALVPFPQQYRGSRGTEYQPQAINRRHAQVQFEEPFGIHFEWDAIEQMLLMPRGKERIEHDILDPAMSQIGADIDFFCAKYAAQHAASVVGALGTNPTTFDAVSGNARQLMVELGCPNTGEMGMIVPPVVMRTLKNSAVSYMQPVEDVSKRWRKGIVGSGDNFEWYESAALYRHTAGTVTSPTVTTAPADGATTIVLTCTTGNTLKKGDKIAFDAVYPVHPQTRQRFSAATKTFNVEADATAVSSSMTITISPPLYGPPVAGGALGQYQNVDALPLASAGVTLWPGTTSPNGKTGQIGLALHPNAFGLIGKAFPMPKASSVEIASQKRDPDSGLSVAFIRDYDVQSLKFRNRFDTVAGAGTFFNDACAVAICCG